MTKVSIIDNVTLSDGTWMESVIDIKSDIQGTWFAYTSTALTVADATNFAVGGDISGDGVGGNDGVGVVRQIDSANNILYVDTTSGTWIATHGIDNVNPYVASETSITTAELNGFRLKRFTSDNLTPTGSGNLGTYI